MTIKKTQVNMVKLQEMFLKFSIEDTILLSISSHFTIIRSTEQRFCFFFSNITLFLLKKIHALRKLSLINIKKMNGPKLELCGTLI